MPLLNSPTEFGAVTKTFHWVTALLVICLVAVGFYMGDMAASTAKLQTYNLHKSFGITVLAITFCRILWHLFNKKPDVCDPVAFWEPPLMKPLYRLFYVLLVAMPLSGWLMSSAAGRPVSVFGLPTLPNLVSTDKGMAGVFKEAHEIIGFTIIATVALHIIVVIKRHFVDKDPYLKRMLPWS